MTQEIAREPQTPVAMHYLAAPYSHDSRHVREARVQLCNLLLFYLAHGIHKGEMPSVFEGLKTCRTDAIFSPLSHTEGAAEVASGAKGAWKNAEGMWFRNSFAHAVTASNTPSGRIVVLELPGWEESKGVTKERALFSASRSFHVSFEKITDFLAEVLGEDDGEMLWMVSCLRQGESATPTTIVKAGQAWREKNGGRIFVVERIEASPHDRQPQAIGKYEDHERGEAGFLGCLYIEMHCTLVREAKS